MHDPLPRLRYGLDATASPLRETPGLLLRDPLRYTDSVVVVPPPWAHLLQYFDGEHSTGDAQAFLTRYAGGQIVPSSEVHDFVRALDEAGFLDTERFRELKREREDAFRAGEVRSPSHAGTAYPESRSELEAHFDGTFFRGTEIAERRMPRAIVAPHVSPAGGVASYRAAYDVDGSSIDEEEPTFVVLGTSHYGEPERVGITRKPFVTPLGRVEVATEIVDELVRSGKDAFVDEDYCHVPEHSIEFQVVFLQHRLKRPFRIVPLLVGPFADSLLRARRPETLDSNERCFGALSELAARSPSLYWILGVDMAHMGRRYGNASSARAGEGAMTVVGERDRERLERVCASDAEGFFELVYPGVDELSWCGYSPLYAFLHAVAPVLRLRGTLRHYEQWNIDPESVVSFGALHFV